MREIEVSSDVCIRVEEQYELENDAGAVVWDAALVLSYFLIRCQEESDPQRSMLGKSVIEIGSGTGAVGLVAAALGASPVVVTDLPHLIPHMDANIKSNNMQHAVTAMDLEWGNAAHITAVLKFIAKACMAQGTASSTTGATEPGIHEGVSSTTDVSGSSQATGTGRQVTSSPAARNPLSRMHPDVIIGSDVIYQLKELDTLFFTLAVLSGPNTTILLSHEDRPGTETFHEVAKAHGFKEQKVPTDLMHPDWRSEDIHIYVMKKDD